LQGDAAIKKTRPVEHNLSIHARFESIIGGKDDVLTAHHSGLTEAEVHAVVGCGFVMQWQWDRVPVRWPMDRAVLWPLDCRHLVLRKFPLNLRRCSACLSEKVTNNLVWLKKLRPGSATLRRPHSRRDRILASLRWNKAINSKRDNHHALSRAGEPISSFRGFNI
jgi:hypothetical protein